MAYNPRIHHRRSIRLRGYDYRRPGFYFFTTCIKHMRCILGEVVDGEMHCNPLGEQVWEIWRGLPDHYAHVRLDSFVVMPNHAHGIVELLDIPMPPGKRRHPFSEVVRSFKSFSASRINEQLMTPGQNRWHRNYWNTSSGIRKHWIGSADTLKIIRAAGRRIDFRNDAQGRLRRNRLRERRPEGAPA